MQQRTSHVAGGAFALVWMCMAGCLGVEPDAREESSSPIVHGSLDPDDAAVVALTYAGQQLCSGTLVSTRTVLTAGHCLRSTGLSPLELEVYFGGTVGGDGQSIACVAGSAHPRWYVDRSGVPFYDVAYLTLASDAPVAPVAWQSTELPNIVGQSVRMVGYGVTDAERQTGNGKRRTVNETITSQDSDFLYYGNGRTGTCQGDSGGPAFLVQDGVPTLVAVTSFGDESCVEWGVSTRVDTFADFLLQHITGGTLPRPEASDEREPNNSRTRANVLDGAGTVRGTIGAATDVDYFKLSVPAGATVSATLAAPRAADYGLRLTNGSGALVAASENGAGVDAAASWHNASTDARVLYLEALGVGRSWSATEPYTLAVQVE